MPNLLLWLGESLATQSLIFVTPERVAQLVPKTLGDRMTTNTVAFGPAIARHVKRSEYHIDYWEMDREVFVNRFFLDAMMPVVKAWRRDDVL